MKAVHIVSFILLVIGGLNWGLVGVAGGYNLVEAILGTGVLTQIVYVLVGLAAIIEIIAHKKNCSACASSSAPSGGGTM